MLGASSEPLASAYDLVMLDLDGVVYVGRHAVPGVSDVLEAATSAGMRLSYITNNASRTPDDVAAHLVELGIPADGTDVVTSAQAAARLLAERLERGDPVFVIGGAGLFQALEEHGLRPVQRLEDDPAAVVSGYSRELRWGTVTDGAILVRRGLPWVASNLDLTVPTRHGLGPGNGVLVDAVGRFARREPVVAGKPLRPLFEETRLRVGGRRPLVVGDRLDTDIEGAGNAGLDSLLVLTGVTGLEELVSARDGQRPTYISATLAGLLRPHGQPIRRPEGVESGGWTAQVEDERLLIEGGGPVDDWWRAVAEVAWRHLDATGRRVDTAGVTPPG